MDITIRNAVREDCPRLMTLIQELADYEKAPQEVTVTLAHFEESGFGPNPVWWAFVCEADGIVQGFALCYIRYSTWKGQAVYLEDLIVTEAMRGKGAGRLLLDQVIASAKEKNISRVVWQVLDWNEPAINFYTKYYNAHIDKGWYNCSMNVS